MKKGNKSNKTLVPANPVSAKNKKPVASPQFLGFLESNYFYLGALAVVILAVSMVRLRLADMPLERDEGEYAYFGHLILNGITPYTEAYNMKLPGIYYMYSLIMAIFGETYRGIHIGFLVINGFSMYFLFRGIANFFNATTGIISAAFYGLMAMSPNVLGFAAHATHFAVFFFSIAICFLSEFKKKNTYTMALLSGIMFGLAFLMKQQAVYFILFGGILILAFQLLDKEKNIAKIIINTFSFSAGVFIPYFLVLAVVFKAGIFDKFWFWTVQYASKYASGLTWETGKEMLFTNFGHIWDEFLWIGLLAVAGIIIVLFTKYTLNQKIITIGLVVFSFLATTPGFYFRQHYFVVLLPALALLAAITLDFIVNFVNEKVSGFKLGIIIPALFLFLIFFNTLSKGKNYYSTKNPKALCKGIYGTNPFTESIEIANFIKNNSSDTDRIAVLGSEPQIPFYANRKSATGHIYVYGLMELHEYNLKMQEEMISEIEKTKPLFMVFCNVPFSWLAKKDSPQRILEWYDKYSADNYDVVGLVDIPDQGASSFYWNADALRNPVNGNFVVVLKRKAS